MKLCELLPALWPDSVAWRGHLAGMWRLPQNGGPRRPPDSRGDASATDVSEWNQVHIVQSTTFVSDYRSYFEFDMALRAAATTASVVKPKCFCRSFQGADAPNVCMPIICPFGPT